MVLDAALLYHLLGELDRVLIMTRNKNHAVGLHIGNSVGETVVVGSMGLLNSVTHRAACPVLRSDISFFIHISTSHQLQSEIVAQFFGSLDLVLDDLFCPLKVALVTVHDNVLVTSIVSMGHLLAKRFNGVLHESLFSVYVEETVPLTRQVSNHVESHRKLFKNVEVSFIHSAVDSYFVPKAASFRRVKSK